MAKPFNLTVALNLQGPGNVKKVVADIRRQLTGIKADVELNIKADSAKNIANINKQLNSLSAAAKNANVNVNSLNKALRQTASSFNAGSSSAQKFSNSTASVSKNVNNSAKDIKQAGTAIQEFGKQSALAVKRFAAFSIVTSLINSLSGAISNSFKEFIAYERQLVRISQVTNGSVSDIKALSSEISRLASNFGVASTDLAEVSVTLAQAGLSANQARVALEALAKTSLAATFNDINSTTEGSIALMRQFKIGVQDLEASLGSINAVAGAFAVEASDIITAISRAGGVFAAASRGVSEGKDALNEFVAVFTSVRATTRESAETIATGLRTIFTRIQRGSTIKFLREFGVELQDSQGKFVGAYEAIRRLSEGLQGLDPRDVRFTRIVEELGGFRQIGKVIPLVQEFATAQEALGVAQRGTASLSADAIKAQLSLAVQFQQTREQFSALIREIGQSATFQTITKVVLGLASAFIKVAGALKPILPLLTALTAVKGLKFITEFISGFKGGLGGAGIGGIGKTIGGALGGGSGGTGGSTQADQAIQNNITALNTNTNSLSTLTSSVSDLNTNITSLINSLSQAVAGSSNQRGGTGPFGYGPPKGFARGGSVPGTGSGDTVPAMLEPGEFVIRKSAVEAFGAGNLANINKYAGGDIVKKSVSVPRKPLTARSLSQAQLPEQAKAVVKGIMFENDFATAFGTNITAGAFPDIKDETIAQAIGGPEARALELKYADTAGTRSKYKKSLGDIPSSQIPMVVRKAKGGGISGSDTVPALLTPGEFVVNKKSAQAFGYGNLKKINGYNKGGMVGIQKFAGGGVVEPSLRPALDKLDANLRGIGALLEDIFVTAEASASEQKESVEALQNMITEINQARASGDKDKTAELEANLKSELREVVSLLAQFKKDKGLVTSGGVTRPGGLGYPGSMQTLPGNKPNKLGMALEKLTSKIDKLSNITGSFVGTFSAGLAAAIPQIDKLVTSFDQLNSTTIAASEEFKSFRGAIEQGASLALSGSIAARQAGLGQRGAAIAGGLSFAGGAVAGGIAGGVEARMAEFMAQAGAADVRVQQSRQDFDSSENQRERLQALSDFTQASADYSNQVDAANREFSSSTARAGRAVGKFTDALIQGLTGVAAIRSFRGRGFAKGGPVYASKGTFVAKGTDTVPAMLTPGEFVVNAKSTKNNLGLLKAINKSRGGYISGGVQYLQRGGMAMPFDEAIRQGYSTSEAMRMNREYQQSRGPNVGGSYLQTLSAFYNPFHKGRRGEGNDAVGGYIRGAGRASMAIGLSAAAAAGGLGAAGIGTTGTVATGLSQIPVVGGALSAGARGLAGLGSRAMGGIRGLFGRGAGAAKNPFGNMGGTMGQAAQKTAGAAKAAKAAGGGGGILGRLGSLANIGSFLGMAAPGIAGGVSDLMGTNVEEQIRATEASQSRFGKITEGARMRGRVGRLESPLAQRAVDRFSAQRAAGGTLESQRRVLGQLSGAGEASAGFVQEQARQQALQQALRAQGLQIKPDQTVEEFLQSDEYNKLTADQKKQAQESIAAADKLLMKDAFIAAKQKEYAAEGLTAEQAQARLNKELAENTDKNGELIGAARKRAELEIGLQEELAAKAAKAAMEMSQFNKQTASLTAIMSRLSAGMIRVGQEIDHIIARTDSYTDALQGNATAVASVAASGATRDAEVLGNLSAYSSQELEQTLGRVTAGLGGSEPIRQAGELVKAQQVLEKIRPSIEAALKEEGGSSLSQADVAAMLEKGFEGVNIDEDIKQGFIDAAARQIQGGGEEGAKNIDAFLAKSAQAQKLLQQYSQLSAEGLKKLAQQSDKLTQSLLRTTELQIKKAEIEINSANSLKQALGFKLTPGEQVAASQARVKALTGGETDPGRIFEDLTMDLDKRRAIEEAGPEAVRAATTSGELAELNKSIAQSRQALEFLANDTTAADAALQRIAERDKQLRAQSETALDLASDPTKALEFIGQSQSLSRVLSGQGGQQDVAAGRAALDQLEGMIPQEQFDALRERFFAGVGQSLGLQGEMSPFAAGAASDMEGKAKDPIIAAEMKNLEEINAVRKSAMDQLIALEQASANALNQSIVNIDNQLTQTLGPLVEQINTELEKFKNGVAAANNAGAAPPPPAPAAPPPPVPAAPVPAAPAAPGAAGVAAPTAAAPAAAAQVAEIAGNLQATGQVDLVPQGTMNVVVSFAGAEAETMAALGQQMQAELGNKIANAIFEKSNSTLDIRSIIS